MGIVWTVIVGLIVGYVARAVLPGKDSLGMLATGGLGIAAGIIGGFLGGSGGNDIVGIPTAGILYSIVIAIVLLLAYRFYNNKK